jgi:CheY-like chemotaxis protein
MPLSILVVEDDDDVREMVSTALRNRDYSVVSVPNAEVALQILKEGVRFDLLFTDIVMPGGVDGFALADCAKALQPAIKVLYATGFSEGTARPADQLHGRLIQKPFRPNQLVSEVRAALQQ